MLFLHRVTQTLQRVLGFDGATQQVDAERPVTLVYDISREAERAGTELAGAGIPGALSDGYVALSFQNVHAAGGQQEAQLNLATTLAALGFEPGIHDFWLLDVSARITVDTIVNFQIASIAENLAGTALSRLLAWGTGDGAGAGGFTATNFLVPTFRTSFPIRYQVAGSASLTARIESETGAAATITVFLYGWIGARGATPPGMA